MQVRYFAVHFLEHSTCTVKFSRLFSILNVSSILLSYRSLTFHSEVSYVKTKRDEEADDTEDEDLYKQIKGSLSTKIEAVVKTLIKIQTLDPNAKSLVFSTWNGVLDILGEALDQNDIHYAALQSQGKFKRNLQKFKNRDDVKVLLIPLKSGANGLNLIEASHVLLGKYYL